MGADTVAILDMFNRPGDDNDRMLVTFAVDSSTDYN